MTAKQTSKIKPKARNGKLMSRTMIAYFFEASSLISCL